MNILVVEDDLDLALVLAEGLREEAHRVDIARDGATALEISRTSEFDLVLLDFMLPGMNGLDVARQLRCRKDDVGILFLTARNTIPDVISGLDAGGDDYLTKPFSFQELLARVRSFARRRARRPKCVLEARDLLLETDSFRTFRNGKELHLSFTEFRLLELLVRNSGRVVTRPAIIEALWGERRDVDVNTIDAFVRLVRKKIDDTGPQRLIRTHRGIGYSIGIELCA